MLIEHAQQQDKNFQTAKTALEKVKADVATEGRNITNDLVGDFGKLGKNALQVIHNRLETDLAEVNVQFKNLYEEQQRITEDSKTILVWMETYNRHDAENMTERHSKAMGIKDIQHKAAIDTQAEAHNAHVIHAEKNAAGKLEAKVQVNESFLKEVEAFVSEVNAILTNKNEYRRIFDKMSEETATIKKHITDFRTTNKA